MDDLCRDRRRALRGHHGGVTTENARAWIDAGAVAVGVGGGLTRGDPAGIQQRAEQLVARLSV
ncbi:MAG TPA: hypothetical protein VMI33_06045 [Streptosporangiaceae bacterium]|nr:hypothetical protein [Streptosporangiaceae bacterium]